MTRIHSQSQTHSVPIYPIYDTEMYYTEENVQNENNLLKETGNMQDEKSKVYSEFSS